MGEPGEPQSSSSRHGWPWLRTETTFKQHQTADSGSPRLRLRESWRPGLNEPSWSPPWLNILRIIAVVHQHTITLVSSKYGWLEWYRMIAWVTCSTHWYNLAPKSLSSCYCLFFWGRHRRRLTWFPLGSLRASRPTRTFHRKSSRKWSKRHLDDMIKDQVSSVRKTCWKRILWVVILQEKSVTLDSTKKNPGVMCVARVNTINHPRCGSETSYSPRNGMMFIARKRWWTMGLLLD